ncbi:MULTISPECIES: nitroreductase family protein [unclassified Clostridium]|uniref:nitroreductase family protein n=1 Tax=unclassified Clostridium TaxID=2614128 RepID=UPI000297385D|nr:MULTISPECIES: nitroreductase family protein [unclassified Clostridium]EKQ50896.1 MAG: nitroreductase [Clostridium sp. Maddingley MBC34-26]
MENVIEVIKSRRSIRKYKSEQINDEDLYTVLECGKRAPSGGNSQTWHFTVIQNKEILLKLNKYIKLAFEKLEVDENTYKSKKSGKVASQNDNYSFYYNAPTLIIVSNDMNYSNAMADSACAIENMLLTANYLELGACWINQVTWFDRDENVRKLLSSLGIPENYRVCGSISIGYIDGEKPKEKILKENTVTIIK